MLEKDRHISVLANKLKEKSNENQTIAENLKMGDAKNELLTKFNSEIENLKKENEGLKGRIRHTEAINSKITEELNERESIIERIVKKNELLLRVMKTKSQQKWDEKINSLLEQVNEKNKTINQIIVEAKKTEQEIARKDQVINAQKKQETERNILLGKLARDLERQQESNKKIFDELMQAKNNLKIKEKENADIESQMFAMKNSKDIIENKANLMIDQINSMKKEIETMKESDGRERQALSDEISALKNEINDERTRYEHRIRKLLKDNTEKELSSKTKIDELKDALEKQNYLVSRKESKEKEVMHEINAKFSEIFAMKEEIEKIPRNVVEKNTFVEKDEFKIQEINNIKALIKVSLQHEKNIDGIKKSLVSSGYDLKLVEEASKEF